jgi:hypothetical protein
MQIDHEAPEAHRRLSEPGDPDKPLSHERISYVVDALCSRQASLTKL